MNWYGIAAMVFIALWLHHDTRELQRQILLDREEIRALKKKIETK